MQTFTLHGGTFDFGVHVVIGKDFNKIIPFVNKHLQHDFATENTFRCLGKVIYSEENRYFPILWLPSYPQTIEEVATLSHELLHIVFRITNWASVHYHSSSEEIFCHLLSHLTKQFYQKAKKK